MNLTVGQKVILTVGQKVMVVSFARAGIDSIEGTVDSLGRKYAMVSWGPGRWQRDQFDKETGYRKGDQYGNGMRLKTVEQYETEQRLEVAKRYLFSVGVDVTYRSPLNPQNIHLSASQVEELAAIVKNMLAEAPSDYESEIKAAE